MAARLVTTPGPLKGAVFEVPEGEWSVGGATANQFCLNSAAVSRRHCVFIGSSGQFALHDLDSHNSTLVNGQPITKRPIVHGDEVRIGESVFLFLTGEDEAAPELAPDLQTTELRFEDSI